MDSFRIGHGYDAHRLEAGEKLVLGGVSIPFELGLKGHSDADVISHALMDALLGAAAMGDIGTHFPDTCEEYRGISSIVLLKKVFEKLKSRGWKLVNADLTIVAQKPKLSAYFDRMRKNLAEALETNIGNIGIKATTEEKMGFTGRSEGMAAHAVVLIAKKHRETPEERN
ncbi:MAG: 2-C-methyl-D-erythritol 2,4-cyclodiphosphate synthase [Clostridiales bacterium]|nr:2-C-methyl-D-erythritol 2,4-cyclodiphosphate synthase [Clostridiales bacterium]